MSMRARAQAGFGLIEVLVTLIIVAVGLLGLAGLQMQAQQAELESYQRIQALVLAQDMASRIRSNREAARCYEVSGYIGQVSDSDTDADTEDDDPAACVGWGDAATRQLADSDLGAWDTLLEGSAATIDGGNVGGMTGARGCITYDDTTDPGTYTISVAWQGEAVTQAPTDTCAQGTYGDDRLRRLVSTTISFPVLD